MIRESSERADGFNSLKRDILLDNRFKIISFEGSPSQKGIILGFFDKFLATHSFKNNDKIRPKKDIKNYFSNLFINNTEYQDEIRLKSKIIKSLNSAWLVLVHDKEGISFVFENIGQKWKLINRFSSATDFSNWLYENYSDPRDNISAYQEDGLPEYDQEMRRNDKPWPGNVDGIIYMNDIPVALIEFQTTNWQSVKEHDNNDWWEPKRGRKGDEQRWASIKLNSDTLRLPIIVGVWSPKEKNYRLKLVNSINFSADVSQHIIWGDIIDTTPDNVGNDLAKMLDSYI